jgi:uncharacterized membrane protein YukC
MLGLFSINAYNFIKKNYKTLAIILLIVFFVYFAYFQIKSSESLIKLKQSSYLEVEQAGQWIKQNSDTGALIATKSRPQIAYYSERKVIGIPDNQSDFEQELLKDKPDFLVLSIFENHPAWIYNYPAEKNLTALKAIYNSQNQPVLAIYKI